MTLGHSGHSPTLLSQSFTLLFLGFGIPRSWWGTFIMTREYQQSKHCIEIWLQSHYVSLVLRDVSINAEDSVII